MYLSERYKILIIDKSNIIYSKDLFFSSFKQCKEAAISKCNELKIVPKYFVLDKQKFDAIRKDSIVTNSKMCPIKKHVNI